MVHVLCYTVHLFEMSQQKLGTFWENELFQNFLDKMTLKLKYVITIFSEIAKKTNVNFWLKLA